MTTITALGESKHGTHNQKIDSFLKNNKFEAIFFELPNDFQLYVDVYIKDGYFPDKLESFITGAQKEGNSMREELELLFNYSKNGLVPIICIDSSKAETAEYNKKSPIGRWYLKGESRDEDMFSKVKDYIENRSGNFLLIAGINHLKTRFIL